MGHTSRLRYLSVVVTATVLVGCERTPEAPDAVDTAEMKVQQARNQYDLAGGCFVMRSQTTGAYAKRSGNGYVATADKGAAERFYMKASGLGRYIFSGADAALLTGSAGAVTASSQPSGSYDTDAWPEAGADWTFEAVGSGVYTAACGSEGKALATAADGALTLADVAGTFTFEPASGCKPYPEMPVDITGDTFTNKRNKPVIGFAEVHSHMGMGSEMSDGSGNVGPSAGGVMYGQAVNRFGVIAAVGNCQKMHGPDGRLSGENVVIDNDPTAEHDTQGWPTFADWPMGNSQFHQQMYYKWVERAYRAGLRIMTIHGTNIEALCKVAQQTGGNKDTKPLDEDCNDMSVGVKQVQYLYDMENYIDAQEGGPGKGWFRIVRDPAEARDVIAQGKLAVVPGLEFPNMFGCSVTFNADGTETSGCTKEQIDSEIQRVWDLGVRQIFGFHDVDSALGGTGLFKFTLDAVNYLGTGAFWKTYDCPDGGEGPAYFYDAGVVAYDSRFPAGFGADPLTQALISFTQGRLPTYPTGKRLCNARGLTELGHYALEKMMQRGFVIDIDHAELSIKQDMLDMGAAQSPAYPMISAHGGHGGISMAQAEQIIRQGGLIYPALPDGREFTSYVNRLKPIWAKVAPTRLFAVGYGADSNGLRDLPGPRGGTREQVVYPFKLFDGPGWGPQFRQAGIKPMTVERLTIPESGKYWDINEVGVAHYGMVPDFVEEARIEGGQEAVDALYNSAEAYLRMWEQTLNR